MAAHSSADARAPDSITVPVPSSIRKVIPKSLHLRRVMPIPGGTTSRPPPSGGERCGQLDSADATGRAPWSGSSPRRRRPRDAVVVVSL